MLFSLDFANNPISSWCFFLFLFIDLYFLIPAVIAQVFNPVVELAVPLGILTNEPKEEMETHPVIVETTISEWSI